MNDVGGIPVLHLDKHLLIVDKPAGLLSVPGRGEDKQDCVLTRLQQHYPKAMAVHRLDQVTSGVLLFARNAAMQRAMSVAFQYRRVDKTYQALVEGIVEQDAGRIDLSLAADWPNRPRQKVDPVDGKPAITDWQVIARDMQARRTRMALHPVTGRSHQLRVHMMALGHVIVGDVFYGAQPAARTMLHAARLVFAHPATGEPVDVAAAVPF